MLLLGPNMIWTWKMMRMKIKLKKQWKQEAPVILSCQLFYSGEKNDLSLRDRAINHKQHVLFKTCSLQCSLLHPKFAYGTIHTMVSTNLPPLNI